MKILLYFLIGCIGARFMLVFFAKIAPIIWLKWMGVIALIPASGFLYIFLSGTRKGTGAFGEKIWWNYLRPIHAFLYFMFAFFAISGKRNAWFFLLIDVCIGLLGFFYVHAKEFTFSHLKRLFY
jgi:hypothetical protein